MLTTYNFAGINWSVQDSKENVRRSIEVEDFFSWGSFTIPTTYIKCSLNNQALRKCIFEAQQFIECDFSKIDASDSIFINCLFLDCKFHNANFGKTTFCGSAIVQTQKNILQSPFDGAGMSQTKFIESNTQRAVLANVKFFGLGFRHSIFRNVVFRNVHINHASFENALLEKCDIDVIDFSESSCRGIVFKECTINEYNSTLEKTIGSIGGLEMLGQCGKFNLSFGGLIISNKKDLIDLFIRNSNTLRFSENGKIFEFINIMQFLYKESEAFQRKYLDQQHLALIKKKTIDGFTVDEFSEYLSMASLDAYKRISENGEYVDLDNVLYLLKMMYFEDINDYKFLKILEAIYEGVRNQNETTDYSDSITTSQIDYYFNKVGGKIQGENYRMTLLNTSANWKDREKRIEFEDFIIELFEKAGVTKYRLISLHEGSTEVIIALLSPAYILTILLVLGIEFEYSREHGFKFKIKPANGIKSYGDFLVKIASIFPFIGKKKVNKGAFEEIVESASTLLDYIRKNELSGKVEQETAAPKILKNKESKIRLPRNPRSAALGNKGS